MPPYNSPETAGVDPWQDPDVFKAEIDDIMQRVGEPQWSTGELSSGLCGYTWTEKKAEGFSLTWRCTLDYSHLGDCQSVDTAGTVHATSPRRRMLYARRRAAARLSGASGTQSAPQSNRGADRGHQR